MKQIKIKDLPVDLQQWFNEATAGKRKSSFSIYGYNTRFIIVKKFYDVLTLEKRQFQWIVVEWQRQNNLNSFLFKKVGGLGRTDKAKILKDFSIDLTVVRKRTN